MPGSINITDGIKIKYQVFTTAKNDCILSCIGLYAGSKKSKYKTIILIEPPATRIE